MSTSEHDAVVRRSFEGQVGLFVGEQSPFAHRAATALSWLEPLDAGMIVLDVACGAAHATEQAAPHVRQVVGIDITPALLHVGAQRLHEAGVDNVLLQEGNATALPFVDESFDLVMCRTAIHHMPDPQRAVAEMARVCRPDGRVAVLDMIVPSADMRPRFDDVHRALDPSHAGALLEAELADLLERTVGPLAYGETNGPLRLPLASIMTDVADRDAVVSALEQELAGGAASGLEPARENGELVVSFHFTTVHASRR
jgi:SAM-dependent methyltransferase